MSNCCTKSKVSINFLKGKKRKEERERQKKNRCIRNQMCNSKRRGRRCRYRRHLLNNKLYVRWVKKSQFQIQFYFRAFTIQEEANIYTQLDGQIVDRLSDSFQYFWLGCCQTLKLTLTHTAGPTDSRQETRDKRQEREKEKKK